MSADVTLTSTHPPLEPLAYGGSYVPEPVAPALQRIADAWAELRHTPRFRAELAALSHTFGGRPTPLHHVPRFGARVGHPVFVKREDLLHTGAHKLNSALGQALLARRLGCERLVAESGSGQHAVAVAAAAAALGLRATIHLAGSHPPSVVPRLRCLGADVEVVADPASGVRDALSCALRDWMSSDPRRTFYVPGSTVGPSPYPEIVADLQSVIGRETRRQVIGATGALPSRVVACIGGGANAIGIFSAFLDDAVELIGVERGPVDQAPLSSGAGAGVLHGGRLPAVCDHDGHAIERDGGVEGMRYPAAAPQHGRLRDAGRARYVTVDTPAAARMLREFAALEGIIPAIEPAHALAWVGDEPGGVTVVCLTGRGEKDVEAAEEPA